jgi:hypothetical protein
MGKQACVVVFAVGDDLPKFPGILVDYDGCQQIEAGNEMMLPLGRSNTDFATSVEVYSPFQRGMGLALVQTDLRPGRRRLN